MYVLKTETELQARSQKYRFIFPVGLGTTQSLPGKKGPVTTPDEGKQDTQMLPLLHSKAGRLALDLPIQVSRRDV